MTALFYCLLLSISARSLANERIEQVADKVNSQNATWRANRNNFRHVSMESVRRLLGSRLDYSSSSLPAVANVADFIPESFDARLRWPHCPTIYDIRDQGDCGSCWAFGAASAMSDRYCIHLGKVLNISANELLACCNDCGDGCHGGHPIEAWRYWVNDGLVTGGQYGSHCGCQPYTIAKCLHKDDLACSGSTHATPTCSQTCQPLYGKSFSDDKHFGANAYRVANDTRAIQTEIMKRGPVEAVYEVYEDFTTYESGVYKHLYGSLLDGHAVKIIGWGMEGITPYWLVANSWDIDWGTGGYFKIARGSNECGIEAGIVAGMPEN